jgi:hypothetical protein
MDTASIALLAQNDFSQDAGGAIAGVVLLIEFAIAVVVIAGLWKIFTKAGKPGWAALIPIYNLVVMLEIVDKPIWWLLLFLIPCVNVIMAILVAVELANRFGQGAGFAVGLILLPMIFYPILGFGSAQYRPVRAA